MDSSETKTNSETCQAAAVASGRTHVSSLPTEAAAALTQMPPQLQSVVSGTPSGDVESTAANTVFWQQAMQTLNMLNNQSPQTQVSSSNAAALFPVDGAVPNSMAQSVTDVSSVSSTANKQGKYTHKKSTTNNDVNGNETAMASLIDGFNAAPPARMSDEELSRLPASERRRYERNLREQQRSYRISQQLKHLRDVLAASNIPFKPNKFSILVSVVDYIKELQSRSIMLDADHKRLLDTIRQTNEVVASGTDPGNEAPAEVLSASKVMDFSADSVIVQGIDFRTTFDNCPFPLGVSSLDGRILACNVSFERVLGVCERGQIIQQSLFLYIRNHQDIFEAMADLLKRSSVASETGEDEQYAGTELLLYWSGQVVSSKQEEVSDIVLRGPERLNGISAWGQYYSDRNGRWNTKVLHLFAGKKVTELYTVFGD